MYRNVFNETAFYLVRPYHEDPENPQILYDLTVKQAEKIIAMLKEANVRFKIKSLGECVVRKETKLYLDLEFSAWSHPAKFRKMRRAECPPAHVLYDASGQPVKGVRVNYQPSPSTAHGFNAEQFWDLLSCPLPDAITRFAEWRRFLPKVKPPSY